MPTYEAVSTIFPIFFFSWGSSWQSSQLQFRRIAAVRVYVCRPLFLHGAIKLCIIFGLAFNSNQVVNRLGECFHFSLCFCFSFVHIDRHK